MGDGFGDVSKMKDLLYLDFKKTIFKLLFTKLNNLKTKDYLFLCFYYILKIIRSGFLF